MIFDGNSTWIFNFLFFIACLFILLAVCTETRATDKERYGPPFCYLLFSEDPMDRQQYQDLIEKWKEIDQNLNTRHVKDFYLRMPNKFNKGETFYELFEKNKGTLF